MDLMVTRLARRVCEDSNERNLDENCKLLVVLAT